MDKIIVAVVGAAVGAILTLGGQFLLKDYELAAEAELQACRPTPVSISNAGPNPKSGRYVELFADSAFCEYQFCWIGVSDQSPGGDPTPNLVVVRQTKSGWDKIVEVGYLTCPQFPLKGARVYTKTGTPRLKVKFAYTRLGPAAPEPK